jgi:hypothetical protein
MRYRICGEAFWKGLPLGKKINRKRRIFIFFFSWMCPDVIPGVSAAILEL